ncbi:hypothetical protein A7K93_09405 [Candidatus Methylacidiphilum fumarolicum]|uniref:Uncharacterized protein n=2 Tax=Candidatus Methylacidiphilum fumarolicum TaxID=591154 RepID=I0K099_METFB|nr:hypothetical protein [Candidatus Methylacidiphilum fumarolicum]CCG92918.1 hypothetical protein MFUM_850006 [Methylacidiphilum fumariolicum SolV]TFE67016.1 hypothetical protein A7K73_09610 [Candidatus Methylacidiphilum fumarolicum]TFE72166.1 hypothetical protein A7K93_09405 [Candidatus Methylacidiphilum fumarolicum]TFE72322.1 hypothetical protein A7K72_08855 [Candidatus Methylacidiphilum fumarolicum]TFE76280.1 hypothetical protein A7D33_10445 [Candidatus Methylacidiphilum fumarolicum]
MLAKLAKQYKEKGKKRHHLQPIGKNTGKTAKDRRIRKYNLGDKKRLPCVPKWQADIEREG